jgi:hypothetical protein
MEPRELAAMDAARGAKLLLEWLEGAAGGRASDVAVDERQPSQRKRTGSATMTVALLMRSSFMRIRQWRELRESDCFCVS